MSEVLLINPPMWSPAEHAAFSSLCPPLGLGYLAASLLQHDFSARIVDLSVWKNPSEELSTALRECQSPKLVGITCVTQNYFVARKVARMVKQAYPNTFVVFGGPHVSYTAEEVLLNPDHNVDAVALFEGERTIVDLCDALRRRGPDLQCVAGLAFRDGDRMLVNQPRPAEKNLDSLPFPARHLLPMAEYRRPGTLMSSRGCPQKCIFCISSTYEGNYRKRSAANVVEELSLLRHTWNTKEIYIIDNVFTVDAQRVREICAQIVDRKLEIEFNCVSRADLVTAELMSLLHMAGCRRVEIGVETGTQQFIDAFEKHITLEQVRRAAEVTIKAGIRPMFTFQVGSPFDTEAALMNTHRLAAELRAKGALTFFSIMTPYPGTPLAIRAEELGIKIHAKDWAEYRTSNPVYDSRHLDQNGIRHALYREIMFQTGMGDPFSAVPEQTA